MTYDLLLIGDLHLARLTAALSVLVAVPVEAVDVAAADGGEDRNWDALVLCTYEAVRGDVTWSLDVHVSDAVPAAPDLAAAAEQLTLALGVPVLFSAQAFPPSAYWLAAPDGPRTRARVYDVDSDDGTALVIDAVERPVAALPGVRVEPQPEVIREHHMPTPVTDGFRTWLATELLIPEHGDALWSACTRLGAWETVTVRMRSGWPPDGWYPVTYYRDDLAIRDELAADANRLPPEVTGRFAGALAQVDEAFRSGTQDDPDAPDGRGWWWSRLPDPVPWPAPA
jgi:hypothetical protein